MQRGSDDGRYGSSISEAAPPRAASGWCILRTSGGRTLSLAESLSDAGMEAWTPKRTFKRVKPGKQRDVRGHRITVEIDAPILATFVFAREEHLADLVELASRPLTEHPAFSVFQHAGRFPIVANREVTGLRQAEEEAAAAIQLLRDAETREEADRLRVDMLKSESAKRRAASAAEAERRKALRSERRDFAKGDAVTVDDMAAFTSMSGVVQSSDGRSALVVFGGTLSMKIEAWRLSHDIVNAGPCPGPEGL